MQALWSCAKQSDPLPSKMDLKSPQMVARSFAVDVTNWHHTRTPKRRKSLLMLPSIQNIFFSVSPDGPNHHVHSDPQIFTYKHDQGCRPSRSQLVVEKGKEVRTPDSVKARQIMTIFTLLKTGEKVRARTVRKTFRTSLLKLFF
jgi:hypothetical protein